jgi:hypothetical protein
MVGSLKWPFWQRTCHQPSSASWFWWTPQLPEWNDMEWPNWRADFLYKHLGAGVWIISVRVFLEAPKTTSFPLLKVTMMWAYPIFETLKPKLPSFLFLLVSQMRLIDCDLSRKNIPWLQMLWMCFFSLKNMIFVVVVQTVSLNMLLHRCYAGYIHVTWNT